MSIHSSVVFSNTRGTRISIFTSVFTVFLASAASSGTVTFDALVSGSTAFGFDATGNGSPDVIFSTTDPAGFNTVGPGANQTYIDEPGLEGTSTLPVDLRVDFLRGARERLSFGFALNSLREDNDFYSSINLYDSAGRIIGTTRTVGRYTTTSFGSSSFPEGQVQLSFPGVASFATMDFSSEFGRYIIDNFQGNFSGATSTQPVQSKPALEASVISAFRNFVRTADDVRDRRNETNQVLIECATNAGNRLDGTPCDFDSLRDEQRQANIDLVKAANEAAFSSKDLVTRTSILPGDSLLEKIADLPFLIREALGFFNVIGSIFYNGEEPEIVNAEASGTVGEFTINPDFNLFAVDFTVDFDGASIFRELAEQQFLYDYSFGGSELNLGLGLVSSVETNLFGGDRVVFSFNHLETNDARLAAPAVIPLPAGLPLLLTAIIGLGLMRSKGREAHST